MATHTNGDVHLCCVANKPIGFNLNDDNIDDIWNSDEMKKIRRHMLAGKEIDYCKRCYEEERNGYRSHRIEENDVWKVKLGDEFDKIVNSTIDGAVDNSIMGIDLRLGNLCNLQCVMCRPQDSSRWVVTAKKLTEQLSDSTLKGEWSYKSNINLEQFEWYQRPEIWNELEKHLPSMREIILAGGEPMMIKQHFDFVRRCVETGHSKHIVLRYHTNGTILPDDMIPFWEKFERVEFFLSIDGIGDMNNYIRWPSRWDEIVNNMKKIDKMNGNIKMSMLCSVQLLNFHSITEYVDWIGHFKSTDLKNTHMYSFQPGIVMWPNYLCVKAYPKHIKMALTDHIDKWQNKRISDGKQRIEKIDGVVSFMNSEDWSELLPMTEEYLDKLDSIRKVKYNWREKVGL